MDNIFSNIAPLLNPFGLAKGVGRAAQQVFAPQPEQQQIDPSLYNLSYQNPQDAQVLRGPGPQGSGYQFMGDYLEANQPKQQPMQARPMFSPEEQAWNRAYGEAKVPPVDMSILNSLTPQVPQQAEQLMLPPAQVDPMTGMTSAPQAVPDQFAQMSGQYPPQAPQGANAPPMPGADNGGLAPFERPAPDIGSLMRGMYANQLMSSSQQADANLNYMQNDLMRRSARDNSDDFFGSVLAPIAGGMSNNVNGMNAMGDRWMGQAQARRGERMNLINSLVGRQNRAQEYLQATDPTVIKNQVALYKAQTDANRAANGLQNNQWQHEDRQGGLSQKAAELQVKKDYQNQLVGQKDQQLDIERAKFGELVRKGDINQALADSLIKKRSDDMDLAIKKLTQNFDIQSMLEEGRNSRSDNTIEATNQRFTEGQQGQDRRLTQNIGARKDMQQFAQENINQRAANKIDPKTGKPMVSPAFKNLMQVPPQFRNKFQDAVQKYRSLSPAEQAAEKEAFIAHFHVDPTTIGGK